MSLFAAINTAVSGLTAQSTSFGNISENVANSQTGGYKRIDTSFLDYLTTSTPSENTPGAVVARPDYINDVQGSTAITDNPTAVEIAGQGFFAVSQATGINNNIPTFNSQQYYTRSGDFTTNAQGYLVNPAGQYLNGWLVNPSTNLLNKNVLAPIQISQAKYNPIATANLSLSANLPATPTAGTAVAPTAGTPLTPGTPLASQITVYDALGTAHTVTLNWSQTVTTPATATTPAVLTPNTWNLQISVPDATGTGTNGDKDAGTAQVAFNTAATAGVAAGTIATVGAGTDVSPYTGAASTNPPMTYSTAVAGQVAQPATVTFTTDFGSGPQAITLNLGTYGGSGGVTQYAGTAYDLSGITQDGVPPGSYEGVTTQANGDVTINYNNGQTKIVAQIPVVTFNSPDSLQSQNGQAFTQTLQSGDALAKAAGSDGAGTLVVQALEGSNVDISQQFTNLIVTQNAYSSNAKVVTTANTMLQAALQMIA